MLELWQVEPVQECSVYNGDEGLVSDETYSALERAIEAHLADTLDGEAMVVRDWVLVSATSELDGVAGTENVTTHWSPFTPLYALTGLLHWGMETVEQFDFMGEGEE